jgi:hypothetical protein
MLKNKKLKLIAIISVAVMLTIVVVPKTFSSGLISQNSVPWFWGSDTNANSVVTGDINGDGKLEIATLGYYNDGTHWIAQLHVWNASTMAVINVVTWSWGSNTQATCIAIGNLTGGSGLDIVTGGAYFDGTRWLGQLHIWNGTTLAVEKAVTWLWGTNTYVSSVAIGDVNGDGLPEIVTGGAYFDGTKYISLMHVWTANLAVVGAQSWFWGSNTYVNSVAVGNITGGLGLDIVTGGAYFDGVKYIAQLHMWSGNTLAVEKAVAWLWGSTTEVSSVAIANMTRTSGTTMSIITGGTYNDGTRNVAQVFIWNATTPAMTVLNVVTWAAPSGTKCSSVAVGNVTGGASLDVVAGGYFNDSVRLNAQITEFNGATLSATSSANWFVTAGTTVNSVAIGNFVGQGNRIVACGSFFDNVRSNAQLTIWT